MGRERRDSASGGVDVLIVDVNAMMADVRVSVTCVVQNVHVIKIPREMEVLPWSDEISVTLGGCT